MSRAGRKRAEGQREADGRPSRAAKAAMKPAPPAEAKRLRDAALAGMRDEAYGWEIGRLFLADRITGAEYEAGKRYRRLVEGWQKLNGGPMPHPKPAALDRGAGGSDVDPDSFDGAKTATAALHLSRDLDAARSAFFVLGPLVRSTVEDACLHDRAVVGLASICWLRDGLGALVRHWRIG